MDVLASGEIQQGEIILPMEIQSNFGPCAVLKPTEPCMHEIAYIPRAVTTVTFL